MEPRLVSTKQRLSKPPKPEPPIIHLTGVDYFVHWDALQIGASFFLPTIATTAQVLEVLAPIEEALTMTFAVHTRVEYGRYGTRVWRIQ